MIHSIESKDIMDGSPSTPLLDFQSAMNDFIVMFPSRSRQEIECILWKNNGSIQQTIDDLLSQQMNNNISITNRNIADRRSTIEENNRNRRETAYLSLDEVKKKEKRIRRELWDIDCRLTFELNQNRRRDLLSEQKALKVQGREFVQFIEREERRRNNERRIRRSQSTPRDKQKPSRSSESIDIVDTVLQMSAESKRRWQSMVNSVKENLTPSKRKSTSTSID